MYKLDKWGKSHIFMYKTFSVDSISLQFACAKVGRTFHAKLSGGVRLCTNIPGGSKFWASGQLCTALYKHDFPGGCSTLPALSCTICLSVGCMHFLVVSICWHLMERCNLGSHQDSLTSPTPEADCAKQYILADVRETPDHKLLYIQYNNSRDQNDSTGVFASINGIICYHYLIGPENSKLV